MKLVYFWVDGYKNLNNIGLNLNANYSCNSEYNQTNQKLIVKINERISNQVFGEYLNITTVLGANGTGKTNVLDALNIVLNPLIAVDLEFKYCLILLDKGNFIYKTSDNFEVKIINQKSRQWFQYTKDGYPAGDQLRILSFHPFYRSQNLKTDNMIYTSYDNELKMQDKINKGFYYDRLDEKETALIIGRTLNRLKDSKLLQENRNIAFDKFGWEFNIKDSYTYLILRFRKGYRTLDTFPMTFPIVLRDSKIIVGFYELINTIRNFEVDTYNWYDPKLNIDDILTAILFYSAVWEFITFFDTVEQMLKDRDALQIHENIKNPEKINNILNLEDKILSNIIQPLLSNFSKNIPNEIEFLKFLIKIIKDNNCLFDKIDKNPTNDFIENINKTIGILKNIDKYKNILNKYFDYEKFVYTLKDEYKLSINDFEKGNEYREQTDDINSIYIGNYTLKSKSIKQILNVLPSRFINHFYIINFYKNDKGNYFTYNSLSTGEQRILRFFADILYCNSRDLYLFDEMDLSWHPEWQRKMIYYIYNIFSNNQFKDKEINLIFTTHSPFILSDMPRENVVILAKDKDGKIQTRNTDLSTFAANIHDLFKNNFFFENCDGICTIGEFAKKELEQLKNDLIMLKDFENLPICSKNDDFKLFLKKINNRISSIKTRINNIGEPILKKAFEKELNSIFLNINSCNTAVQLLFENIKLKQKLKDFEDEI